MARKTTPGKYSSKGNGDHNNNNSKHPSTSQQNPPELIKLRRKGKLKPKSFNTHWNYNQNCCADAPVMIYNTVYQNPVPTNQMALYYPPAYSSFGMYPYRDWYSRPPPTIHELVYPLPVLPIVYNPMQAIAPCQLALPQPVVSPQISIAPDVLYGSPESCTVKYISNTSIIDNFEASRSLGDPNTSNNITQDITIDSVDLTVDQTDDLSYYISLPKHLFPSPRYFNLDPNPIIDEFCKKSDCLNHAPWIIDLEFGIPREPLTRPIAVYDVKYNSVHCKNTPGAIHPGFHNCGPGFQHTFLFYYDCVISTWYKGYMKLHQDKSVCNFQSWLNVPMQDLGMCWA